MAEEIKKEQNGQDVQNAADATAPVSQPAPEQKKEEKKVDDKPEVKPFVHLHVHTDMSLLDGAARLTKGKHFPLLEAAVAKGMPGVAITDHGNMFGVFTMYRACADKFKDLKPIIGCEFYRLTAEYLNLR